MKVITVKSTIESFLLTPTSTLEQQRDDKRLLQRRGAPWRGSQREERRGRGGNKCGVIFCEEIDNC